MLVVEQPVLLPVSTSRFSGNILALELITCKRVARVYLSGLVRVCVDSDNSVYVHVCTWRCWQRHGVKAALAEEKKPCFVN